MKSIKEQDKMKVISLILVILPKVKVYLFGSYARGDQSVGSDIDIALDAGAKIEHVKLSEVRSILEGSFLPYNFDVVDMHSISDAMLNAIKNEGVLWNK